MYMAMIIGFNPVLAFSEDMEKAKRKAIKEKKSFCKDDLEKWTWETVSEFYGAGVMLVTDGTTIRL